MTEVKKNKFWELKTEYRIVPITNLHSSFPIIYKDFLILNAVSKRNYLSEIKKTKVSPQDYNNTEWIMIM